MSPIQPHDAQLAGINPWQPMAADGLTPPSSDPATTLADASTAQSITMQASMTRVTQVQHQVDSFLGTLGANLQDNELLRMMIALLILNALLGQDSASSRTDRAGTQALDLLGRMASSESVMLYQSSYSAVQIDYQSTSVAGAQSVQTSGAAAEGNGPKLDLCA